jgi:hypothetical protein
MGGMRSRLKQLHDLYLAEADPSFPANDEAIDRLFDMYLERVDDADAAETTRARLRRIPKAAARRAAGLRRRLGPLRRKQ